MTELFVELPELNLPKYDHQIKKIKDMYYIYDLIRKKMVVLTPEEWVRQHFVHYLIHSLKYPKSLMKIESGVKYHKLNKRSDIKVYDRTGNPFAIVECKSASIPIGKAVFDQVAMYNKSFQAPYIMVTNGKTHYCSLIDFEAKTSKFIDGFPEYNL